MKIPGGAPPDIYLFNFKHYTVMKKEDLLKNDFLKQFKTGEELHHKLITVLST